MTLRYSLLYDYMWRRKTVYCLCGLLVALIIVFQSYRHNHTKDSTPVLKSMMKTLEKPNLANQYPAIKRAQILSDRCDREETLWYKTKRLSTSDPFQKSTGLSHAIFVIRSKSMVYCGVPKGATKTMLKILFYLHMREIEAHLTKKWTHADFAAVPKDQLLNIKLLANNLKKSKDASPNDRTIPRERQISSLLRILNLYMNLLLPNASSLSSFRQKPDLWVLTSRGALPLLHIRSLSQVSQLFSDSFTRLMFVRHPFERLASAYANKILNLAVKKNDIVQFSRSSARAGFCARYERMNGVVDESIIEKKCRNKIPSFQQFVVVIIAEAQTVAQISKLDRHWRPYSILCDVCNSKYNFIGKLETMSEDLSTLFDLLNITDWNSEKRTGTTGKTTSDYRQMFRKLPDKILCELIRLYHDDFMLFDYRPEDYIDRPLGSCSKYL